MTVLQVFMQPLLDTSRVGALTTPEDTYPVFGRKATSLPSMSKEEAKCVRSQQAGVSARLKTEEPFQGINVLD